MSTKRSTAVAANMRLSCITGWEVQPTFAIEPRERGVDSLTVHYLGGWESLEMVERYSKAAKQEIALAEYSPLMG